MRKLAVGIVGIDAHQLEREHAILSNLRERMAATQSADLMTYLLCADQHSDEYQQLISALTIHTTSWFREAPHYDQLTAYLQANGSRWERRPFRMLCVGCSTGEEIYSFALMLERHRQRSKGFDYRIVGVDVDPVSLATARRGHYRAAGLKRIAPDFYPYLEAVDLGTPARFGVNAHIRRRCDVQQNSLTDPLPFAHDTLDWIVCRNVLIYFNDETKERVVRHMEGLLRPRGVLCLGLSDNVPRATQGEMLGLGASCFERPQACAEAHRDHPPASLDASTACVAPATPPDVPPAPKRQARLPVKLIALGASTGGTGALVRALREMPKTSPPVVVVQHMVHEYLDAFAKRLSDQSGLRLGVIRTGARLRPGHLYVAVGDYHLRVRCTGGEFYLSRSEGPPRSGHRPSVDEFFESLVASASGVVAALMTGMGDDGAKGLLRLRRAGAHTICQDEQSCVVYGMPKEAIALGAACSVGDPDQIRHELLSRLELPRDGPLRSTTGQARTSAKP